MRIVMCAMALLFVSVSDASAQEKEQWKRLYTTEEAVVEMDVNNVVFSSDFTGRVWFRLSYAKGQPNPPGQGGKYNRVIEAMEFRCPASLYRVFSTKRFDTKGNLIGKDNVAPDPIWKPVETGSMLYRLFTSGCQLISDKRNNP